MAELPLHKELIPKLEIIPRKMVLGRNATVFATVADDDGCTTTMEAFACERAKRVSFSLYHQYVNRYQIKWYYYFTEAWMTTLSN
jgi:hypothetical protein